jgi:hypothetical protein
MATFTVTTSADAGAGSLRAAVAAANALAGADVIAFDAAVFDGGSEDLIWLTSGQIEITDGLTITGGPAGVTITGDANGDDVTRAGGITDVDASLEGEDRLDDNSRVFDATADLTIDGLTLTGGRTIAREESGGAVRSGANVILIDSTVSGNSTAGDRSSGGGVSGADVTLINSTVTCNSTAGASSDGGGVWGGYLNYGVYGGVTLINSTVSGNSTGGDFSGGGGVTGNYLRLTNSTVSGNSTAGYFSRGGGLTGTYVTLIDSTVSRNSTTGDESGGGGVWGGYNGFYWDTGVKLTNSTVSGNSTAGDNSGGGGVRGLYVTLTNSTVSGNSAAGEDSSGGGVWGGFYDGFGDVTLTNSIVMGNATIFAGADGDEVTGYVTRSGGNILGGNIFEGEADIGDVIAQEVFAATAEIAPGVFAGVLADNGGPTPTIAIRADGPAAGAADQASATATDQRGFERDNAPDLGAFEAGAVGGLKLVGGPEADVLVGGAGDNRIWGRGGNDVLRGRTGDDLLRGGTGDDVISGGRGGDRISGGMGDDMLYGGKGWDIFVFRPDPGADTIFAFDANARGGQDRMDLTALGISATSFASAVTIAQVGDDTLITLQGGGSILCTGIDGNGVAVIDQSDFLLLA